MLSYSALCLNLCIILQLGNVRYIFLLTLTLVVLYMFLGKLSRLSHACCVEGLVLKSIVAGKMVKPRPHFWEVIWLLVTPDLFPCFYLLRLLVATNIADNFLSGRDFSRYAPMSFWDSTILQSDFEKRI